MYLSFSILRERLTTQYDHRLSSCRICEFLIPSNDFISSGSFFPLVGKWLEIEHQDSNSRSDLNKLPLPSILERSEGYCIARELIGLESPLSSSNFVPVRYSGTSSLIPYKLCGEPMYRDEFAQFAIYGAVPYIGRLCRSPSEILSGRST